VHHVDGTFIYDPGFLIDASPSAAKISICYSNIYPHLLQVNYALKYELFI